MRNLWIAMGFVALLAASAQAQVTQKPDKPAGFAPPTDDAIWQVWPAGARSMGFEAIVSFDCEITPDAQAKNCVLTKETPASMGFGAAAGRLMPSIRFTPAEKDGHPVSSRATVTIEFRCHDRCTPRPRAVASFAMPWLTAPTAAQLAAAYPPAALADRLGGEVALLCAVDAAGRLGHCDITEEKPTGHGFAQAAQAVAPDFTADLSVLKGKPELPLRLVIRFRPEAGAAGPPQVLKGPDQTAMYKAYPEKALAAGVKAGRATLNCRLASDGALHDCASSGEEPAGLGFGEAAVSLAPYFRLSAWTADGLPTASDHYSLPIGFQGDILAPGQPRPTEISKPDWAVQPSAREISAYYPMKARRDNATGNATIHCRVNVKGRLEGCVLVREYPADYGFGEAALKMAPLFRMKPEMADGKPVAEGSVTVPIVFAVAMRPR